LNTDKGRWLEIFAVIITGLLKFVLIDWLNLRAFYIGIICLFWITYIYLKYKSNPKSLVHWGIRKQGFKQSFLFILPIAVISTTGIVAYGYLSGAYILNWHILPILILYPLWGLIQQFVMIGLIAGNLKAMNKTRFKNYQIILLTSLLFSLVHYPIGFLMIFTFIMELIFLFVFFRWKNIWPLGLYHGWIATLLLYYVMERDLLIELFKGF
jgi:uncharacterized protein